MQNDPHKHSFPILENVLLSSSQRKNKSKVDNLIAQAQQKAKSIVVQSEKQAEEAQRLSFMAGYERGLMIAADAVCSYLSSVEKQAAELSKNLKEEIQTFLSAFFTEENTVLTMLDNWLAASVKDENATIQLLMPDTCKQFHRQTLSLIGEDRSNNVIIAYHGATEFVFKYKEKIASFDPQMIIDEQKEKMVSLDKLLNECQAISTEALNEFSATINFYLQNSEDDDCE